MGKRFPHWMEAIEGHTNVFLASKDVLKYVSPIISTLNYLVQIHEIRVLNLFMNGAASGAILVLTIAPSLAHIRGYALFDPFCTDQAKQMLPDYTPELPLQVTKHRPV